jgi:hypothetical protein
VTKSNLPPIVIYDYRVLAHMIFNARESLVKNGVFSTSAAVALSQSQPNIDQRLALNSLKFIKFLEDNEDPELTKKWLQLTNKLYEAYPKVAWALMLNRGPNACEYVPHVAVIVDDNGADLPYWRKQMLPDYKAGRKQKTDSFFSVAQEGLNYATDPKSPLYYLSVPGYEADDLAGALVKIKRLCQSYIGQYASQDSDLDMSMVSQIADRELWLYTVDSDWLQLVGRGVTWYNTGPWEPRIRGPQEAIAWAAKRLKVTIQSPEEIVDTKMAQGDKSDNLPKGTKRKFIDLMNIDPDWEISHRHPDVYQQLWFFLRQTEPNQVIPHYKKALSWFRQYQIQTPV